MLLLDMHAPLEMPKRSATDPPAEDIDRYSDLDQKVLLFAPILEEHDLLKKKIEAGVANRPGDLPSVLDGHRYQLQLTARRNERTITNKKAVFNRLKKLLGIDGFLALITIPLGEAVDKNIPKSEHRAFVVEERTGSRSIKVIPQRPAAA